MNPFTLAQPANSALEIISWVVQLMTLVAWLKDFMEEDGKSSSLSSQSALLKCRTMNWAVYQRRRVCEGHAQAVGLYKV